MFSLASALKRRGYKIGLLSNIEEPSGEYFNEQRGDIFDAAVFSCKEGTRKPEKKIYEIALARLGVKAKEAVFIDDREDFVAGAKEIGIDTILFTSPGQAKDELARLSVSAEDR